MKNEIKYKGNTIVRWVAVFEHGQPISEYDSMQEAVAYFGKNNGYEFKYAAAEVINKYGDCNPAVYGGTLKEVMDKLKSVL